MTTIFQSVENLMAQGFEGFKPIRELRAASRRGVVKERGVYIVLRLKTEPPTFLPVSTGGWYKGEDPTFPVADLQARWVPSAIVVYIGKAGETGKAATIHSRLGTYFSFGGGAKAGHRGGKAIWQLADAEELIVCWKATLKDEPRDVEKELIARFKSHFGSRPFANGAD